MKVYVITKGCYSDYRICAVALDEEKAHKLQDKYSSKGDEAEIEVFDTSDSDQILFFNSNLYFATVTIGDKDSNIKVSQIDFEGYDISDYQVHSHYMQGHYYSLSTYILANNEADALKIASDRFAKYRAEELDL